MPRNGAGVYAPPSSSWNPASGGAISSIDWNALLTDLVAALSQSVSQDGQTPATARIPFAAGISVPAGSTGAPSVYRIGDSNSGIYFPANDQVAMVAGGYVAALALVQGLMIGGGTTAERPSGEGDDRTIRWNSDLRRLEVGEDGVWSVAGAPTGTIVDYAGLVPPAGWLVCSGAAVSRSTYSRLYEAITLRQAGTRVTSSALIVGLTTTFMTVGMPVSGVGIPDGTTIATVNSGTQITLSAAATSSGTSEIVVAPWGVGDGSTTFNLPDYRSRTGHGRGDMGANPNRDIYAGSAAPGIDDLRVGATGAGVVIVNKIIRI